MTPDTFSGRAHDALADAPLRANLRRAMDGLMQKRRAQFPDEDALQALRDRAEAIRSEAIERLPELLEQLEANCTARGMVVHWARDADEANALILDLLRQRKVRSVVKGKSMASEEIHLNAHLARHGIEAVETDLGEYVIQLAGETPSHIIMPCIHKNRHEIADLFARHLPHEARGETAAELTAIARRVLRRRYLEAGAGLSGVNFAVAETGTLCLVENEGNGRMCTTVPPLHIAIMGIDKVVARLTDVAPLLTLLTRSATGQPITTYVNMISGPRRAGELDGPHEVHLVLLDNGRSRVHADPQLRATLRCIRCGACMNHCPVYVRVGGHAYGAVYPGPIGKILTPQLDGLDAHPELPHASTLCRACVDVCPVRIPITELLVRLRHDAEQAAGSPLPGAGSAHSVMTDAVWKAWQLMHGHGAAYRAGSHLLSRLGPHIPASAPLLREWTSVRTAPAFAPRTLHDLTRERGVPDV